MTSSVVTSLGKTKCSSLHFHKWPVSDTTSTRTKISLSWTDMFPTSIKSVFYSLCRKKRERQQKCCSWSHFEVKRIALTILHGTVVILKYHVGEKGERKFSMKWNKFSFHSFSSFPKCGVKNEREGLLLNRMILLLELLESTWVVFVHLSLSLSDTLSTLLW